MEFTHRVYNSVNQKPAWRVDKDGMLKCTASILQSGILNYSPKELKIIPDKLKNKATIKLYISPEAINNAETLSSIEGKNITLDHAWQVCGDTQKRIGNVSGSPKIVNAALVTDVLISNTNAKKGIMLAESDSNRLVELSGAYNSVVNWTSGFTPEGDPFDGSQNKINFNHIALLKVNEGRGGNNIRILNNGGNMADNNDGNTIIKPADATAANTASATTNANTTPTTTTTATPNTNTTSGGDGNGNGDGDAKQPDLKSLSSDMAAFVALKNQIADLLKQLAEKDGKLSVANDALTEARDTTAIQNKAVELIADKENAGKILNSRSIKDCSIDDLMGHSLKLKVMNAVRKVSGKDDLAEDVDQNFVNGMFIYAAEQVKSAISTPSTPSTASAVNISNSKIATPGDLGPADQLKRRYENRAAMIKGV